MSHDRSIFPASRPLHVAPGPLVDPAGTADQLARAAEDAAHSLRCGCDVTPGLRSLRTRVGELHDQLATQDPVTVALAILALGAVAQCLHTGAGADVILTGLAAAADTLGQLHVHLDEAGGGTGDSDLATVQR